MAGHTLPGGGLCSFPGRQTPPGCLRGAGPAWVTVEGRPLPPGSPGQLGTSRTVWGWGECCVFTKESNSRPAGWSTELETGIRGEALKDAQEFAGGAGPSDRAIPGHS